MATIINQTVYTTTCLKMERFLSLEYTLQKMSEYVERYCKENKLMPDNTLLAFDDIESIGKPHEHPYIFNVFFQCGSVYRFIFSVEKLEGYNIFYKMRYDKMSGEYEEQE